jgi:MYXO-CTERM domain-containing protein
MGSGTAPANTTAVLTGNGAIGTPDSSINLYDGGTLAGRLTLVGGFTQYGGNQQPGGYDAATEYAGNATLLGGTVTTGVGYSYTGLANKFGAFSDGWWIATAKTLKVEGVEPIINEQSGYTVTQGVQQSSSFSVGAANSGDIIWLFVNDSDGSGDQIGTNTGKIQGATSGSTPYIDGPGSTQLAQYGLIEDSSGNYWEVFYNSSYYTQTVGAGGSDIALEAVVNGVPEASTMTMLAGAALMGLGYAGLRRIRRRKDTDGDDSAGADEAGETAAS